MRPLAQELFSSPSIEATSPKTWKEVLSNERKEQYFLDLLKFVESERLSGRQIFPPNSEVFNALGTTPFENVKVVILGQDPYHGFGQAHGLCFSVRPPVPPPPSLVNIFKELKSDLGVPIANHGCLEKWAQQGVLLLNAVLTVQEGKPGSHANRGWERFTDAVIRKINDLRPQVVFLLWGSYAQKKASFVDTTRHTVLKAPHPSPLSAHNGFFGCKHFSKANDILVANGQQPINWDLR